MGPVSSWRELASSSRNAWLVLRAGQWRRGRAVRCACQRQRGRHSRQAGRDTPAVYLLGSSAWWRTCAPASLCRSWPPRRRAPLWSACGSRSDPMSSCTSSRHHGRERASHRVPGLPRSCISCALPRILAVYSALRAFSPFPQSETWPAVSWGVRGHCYRVWHWGKGLNWSCGSLPSASGAQKQQGETARATTRAVATRRTATCRCARVRG